MPHVEGEFLSFLDDDAWLLDDDALARMTAYLRAHPDVGMLQPRIVDPARADEMPSRWIPRLGRGIPTARPTCSASWR